MVLWRKRTKLSNLARKPKSGNCSWYTFMLVSDGESSQTIRFRLPRVMVYAGMFGICLLVGAGVAGALHYQKMSAMAENVETLKRENTSLRSEHRALVKKTKEVQAYLNEVELFSQKLREAAQVSNLKKDNPSQKKNKEAVTGSVPTLYEYAIGPLSEQEFRWFQSQQSMGDVISSVNYNNLEFKEGFSLLHNLQERGESQIKALDQLLAQVLDYNKKLSTTPTFKPVPAGRLTSVFGPRKHPIFNRTRMHKGIDLAAHSGARIYAAGAGKVKRVIRMRGYGLVVEVSHGRGLVTRYAHTRKVYVKRGQKVYKGQPIAEVGMTGYSTGPHLHFEVLRYNRPVNPLKYIGKSSKLLSKK